MKQIDYFLNGALWGAMLLGAAGFVSCGKRGDLAALSPTAFNLFTGMILGGLVGGVIGGFIGTVEDRGDEVRAAESSRQAEVAAQEAASAAARAARSAAHAANMVVARRTMSEAQADAGRLAITLGQAELTLDRAQEELENGLYSPFWEAIEGVTANLSEFDKSLTSIEGNRSQYLKIAPPEAPSFSLGLSILPNPEETRRRLVALYRMAQTDPHFAIVYEQRRTNAILIAGFRSLGQAIEGLGDRITDAIGRLGASLDCRLASLESSLESAAAAAAVQSAALREELQRSTAVNETVVGQLRHDAAARSESEHMALRMLDNIQRRRRPSLFDRPRSGRS